MGMRRSISLEDEALALERLALRFPKAPRPELRRFLQRRSGAAEAAAALYERHLEWRGGRGSPERLRLASRSVPENYIRPGGLAADGSRIVLVQGARFDASVSPEEYVLACAEALDRAVPPDCEETATILIDLRPRDGWANAPAMEMVPFWKSAARILPDNFPGKAHRVIVYPLTPIVKLFWSMISGLLDPSVNQLFVMLYGPSSLGSPCPVELGKYVDLDALPEDARGMHEALAA